MGRSEKSFRVASYRWRRAVEVIYALKKAHPELVLVLSFEDLINHPKENAERIAAFLGVEYQDRMLEGPLYNPWYPEAGMNKDKVNRAERESIDFKLAERFPAIYRQYQELLELGTTAGEYKPPRHVG
jgi:hypothetical protein